MWSILHDNVRMQHRIFHTPPYFDIFLETFDEEVEFKGRDIGTIGTGIEAPSFKCKIHKRELVQVAFHPCQQELELEVGIRASGGGRSNF